MNQRPLEDLNGGEFEKLIEAFIERDAPGSADLPMDVFFELWAQIEGESARGLGHTLLVIAGDEHLRERCKR